MPRKAGDHFVITSDRDAAGMNCKVAPKRVSEEFQVWTGDRWSTTLALAKLFSSLDEAEEYMRANYALVMA